MFDTLNDIKTRIFNAIVSKISAIYPSYNPDINSKNVENAFAESHAVELWNFQILKELINRQDNPLTADSISEKEYGTLEQWGLAKLGRNPFINGKGEYQVEFSGLGGIYEAGTTFTNPATGFSYTLKSSVTVSGGSIRTDVNYGDQTVYGGVNINYATGSADISRVIGTVIAEIPGLVAALSPGAELSVSQPISGINNPSQVIAVVVEPTDEESLAEYRDDILNAYRIPPRGGARGDYCALWAESVSGVKNAYYYAGGKDGLLGSAWMIIESENGAATPELVNAVIRRIDEEISVTDCSILFESIVVTPITITIEGFFGVAEDDIGAATNAIFSACENYVSNIRPHMDGVDRSSERNDSLIRIELVSIALDAVLVYGGVISDAYWLQVEKEKVVAENEKFELSNVLYA